MDYSRFQVVYANVPEKMRNEIIAVVNDRPYSWNAAFFEMRNNTALGQAIYDQLVDMDII